MPKGSFWSQPAGEVHITAAKGNESTAYIEIDNGPYLVKPPEEAFDTGERPVNVDPANFVWLQATGTTWIDGPDSDTVGPKLSFLWGKPMKGSLNGTALWLPADFRGTIAGKHADIRAVVIDGTLDFSGDRGTSAKRMAPGSYFRSPPDVAQHISTAETDCLLYIRSEGRYSVVAQPQ